MSEIQENGIFLTYVDIIGYVSILFSLFAFISKSKKKMRIYGLFSTLLFGMSIYYYNGINGLFVSSISTISKILSLTIAESKLVLVKKLSPLLAIVFFLFFNKEGAIGILPAISLIFIVYADMNNDLLKTKIIYYGSALCWLTYAIFLNSLPAILFDIVGIASITYSIVQLKNKKKIQR